MLSKANKVAVVFASLSGSAQRVAETLQQNLQSTLPSAEVELLDMLVVNPEAFSQYDFIFMGASTYGDGDLNPFAEVFVASMSGRESEKMWEGLPFAIFGLGDSSYVNFCSAADLLVDFAQLHGGIVHQPILKIDVLTQDWDQQEQMIREWSASF